MVSLMKSEIVFAVARKIKLRKYLWLLLSFWTKCFINLIIEIALLLGNRKVSTFSGFLRQIKFKSVFEKKNYLSLYDCRDLLFETVETNRDPQA